MLRLLSFALVFRLLSRKTFIWFSARLVAACSWGGWDCVLKGLKKKRFRFQKKYYFYVFNLTRRWQSRNKKKHQFQCREKRNEFRWIFCSTQHGRREKLGELSIHNSSACCIDIGGNILHHLHDKHSRISYCCCFLFQYWQWILKRVLPPTWREMSGCACTRSKKRNWNVFRLRIYFDIIE